MKLSSLTIPSLVAIASLISGVCYASPLTPEAALSRAMGDKGHKNMPSRTAKDYRLVYTEPRTNSDEAAVYVFATGEKGYMILSADDVAYPVLGYSDSPIDISEMPKELSQWLKGYAQQIEAAQAYPKTLQTAEEAPKAPIAPMLRTHWGYREPYNKYVPEVDGVQGYYCSSVCAMAQLMNYHKYPEVGKGSNTYISDVTELTIDFSKEHFDWSNMTDYYDTASGEAQIDAVSRLMYAVALSANCIFTKGGAYSKFSDFAKALNKYFGYSDDIYIAQRGLYSSAQWHKLVYYQLVEYGPVVYYSADEQYTNVIILDGYRNGFFHVNWNLAGWCDGYYRLDALCPDTPAAGFGKRNYYTNHSMICNVSPHQPGLSTLPELVRFNNWSISPVGEQSGCRVKLYVTLRNNSVKTTKGALGIKYMAADGTITYSEPSPEHEFDFYQGYYSNVYCQSPSLPDGLYTVTPVYRPSGGEWQDIPCYENPESYLRLQITEGKVNYYDDIYVSPIYTENLQLETPLYFNHAYRLTCTIVNDNDVTYYDNVRPEFWTYEDHTTFGVVYGQGVAIELPPKSRKDIVFEGVMQTYTHQYVEFKPYEGKVYILSGIDDVGRPTINLNDIETSLGVMTEAPTVEMNDLHITDIISSGNTFEYSFSGTLSCIEGYFGNPLAVRIYNVEDTPGEDLPISWASASTTFAFLNKGESKTINVGGDIAPCQADKEYKAVAGYGFDGEFVPISNYVYFTAGVSGIEDVTVDGGEGEYYNMQGVRVDKPSHGYYIRRTGGKATKVYVP